MTLRKQPINSGGLNELRLWSLEGSTATPDCTS
jgi:hypothetical protein